MLVTVWYHNERFKAGDMRVLDKETVGEAVNQFADDKAIISPKTIMAVENKHIRHFNVLVSRDVKEGNNNG